ncbi:MAG: hypothetical protein AB9873_09290 [Syntrophobacteraceae bacterium]
MFSVRECCRVLNASVLLVVLLIGGCMLPSKVEVKPAPQVPKIVFPPHETMQSGAYSALLAESQKTALECSEESQCAVALFNLAFVYSYPQSPYYQQSKGLYYLDALMKTYPQNPLSSEAKVWKELIKKYMVTEYSKKLLKGELKSKKAALKELQKQVAQPKEEGGRENHYQEEGMPQNTVSKESESESESESDRMERDIQRKLERSQAIDAEIDQKERKLLR